MPAYTTPNPIPNDAVPSKVPPGCYLVMGDNRKTASTVAGGAACRSRTWRQGLPDLDELEGLGVPAAWISRASATVIH
jgi:hypothetical protein